MGIFRKILAEGKDLASVVDGIKKAVLNFREFQDTEEATFRKDLTKVEDQASKALMAIAKVLDQHKGALEAMYDTKWSGQINPKLVECGHTVMGVADPLASTLSEMANRLESHSCPMCGQEMTSNDETGRPECVPCATTHLDGEPVDDDDNDDDDDVNDVANPEQQLESRKGKADKKDDDKDDKKDENKGKTGKKPPFWLKKKK